MTSISVIIPTLGRPTLARAIASVRGQMAPGDEILVVYDAAEVPPLKEYDICVRYMAYGPTRSWGAAQYDYGMDQAQGDWCVFLPDDDYMAPGALDAIRRGVEGKPGVHIFACQMNHWGGRVLRGSKNVCEVTANQIVVPAPHRLLGVGGVSPELMPRWAGSKAQTFDHAYLMAMLKWYGQTDPIYHDEVICIADQQNNGRVF